MQTQEMALLTHDTLLLPQGRVEIRVIDPRYLSMIAEILKGHYPLVFGMKKANAELPCYDMATQCEIIDFNQLDDESLGLVLEGKQKVRVLSAAQRRDGIWISRVLRSNNWQQEPIYGEFELISAALEQFYEVNPDLFGLYDNDIHLEDATWVSQRWLEVLPLYNQDKQRLLNQPNCHQTMNFVLELIKSHARDNQHS
ncbi:MULTISPECIES: LON peptidase substrate-binding domain-containing protein [Shewanella]|uniref:LON peptidase substrate-binding domain-containing protein n=1 Tax=Shewanella fidelis TaxID=173509 RepID=A0AAW8NRT4_9GAMM|nr:MULTISPECIES: LON peptidase substrate-binding domain-containing protein [Shewanella]MDR8525261.1 LON peptidase substrate-binding domain-containing protein [Shewanella fidelis]MDW4814090.1 LON peptidase substrate-binding domain-containing protein [Shewanella fidelis]MDW4818250.1 LON peptidase substrate-binding domain-containing protein [Shewanella fidelis]MDW4822379.1 LON peptidase substrate-binding domain-containing protein [Shewanella fidelis]MDW4826517.1 LON peptidase substrate-binding do